MRLLRLQHYHTCGLEIYDTYEIPDGWDVEDLYKEFCENERKNPGFGDFLIQKGAKKVGIDTFDFWSGKVKED